MYDKKWKYNYVIFGGDGYYNIAYRDITDDNQVLYLHDYRQLMPVGLPRWLTRITFSTKINKLFHYPFRNYTFPRILRLPFQKEEPICFIFFGCTAFLFNSPYMHYLKAHYPNATYVLYMQDIIAKNKQLDIQQAKMQFDYIFSYDHGDCSQYGLLYHPTPYSMVTIPDDPTLDYSDVYFCGKGKERYKTIENIYKQLTGFGLRCDFFLTDMPSDAPRLPGIHYNKPLSYTSNLQHIMHTHCILEVMQLGADGFTPRLWESLFYNKHLLSDNTAIKDSIYYKQDSMHFLHENMQQISRLILSPASATEKDLLNSLSPKQLLTKIENMLTQ